MVNPKSALRPSELTLVRKGYVQIPKVQGAMSHAVAKPGLIRKNTTDRAYLTPVEHHTGLELDRQQGQGQGKPGTLVRKLTL